MDGSHRRSWLFCPPVRDHDHAGLPLVQCLDILSSQEPSKYFKSVLLEVKSDVESGLTFADSLKKHPKVFDSLFVNLVAAGEIGGILDTILNRLATYIEKNVKLIRQVKGAMMYPIGILIVAGGVVFALLKWVIPTFAKMFSDMGDAIARLDPGCYRRVGVVSG